MNSVVHFDIPVVDPEKAKKFYTALFGWDISEVPGMNYWIAKTVESDKKGTPKKPGAINGGIGRRSDAHVDHPYFTIHVDDIDSTLKAIEAAGGTIAMPKQTMGEWGAMARFMDPDGNLVGLHEGGR